MAGFICIKRKLELLNPQTNKYQIVFKDDSKLHVGYQKFYSDEEMQEFSDNLFYAEARNLKVGTYRFSIDTLGVYINSEVIYKLEKTISISVSNSNLTEN